MCIKSQYPPDFRHINRFVGHNFALLVFIKINDDYPIKTTDLFPNFLGDRFEMAKLGQFHLTEGGHLRGFYNQGRNRILYAFSLDQILYNDNYDLIEMIDKINTPKVDELCVLRAWIYRFLTDDMKTLFKEND